MKLILANRQTDDFRAFYADLQSRSAEPFDYSPYKNLLFCFDTTAEQTIRVHNIATGKNLQEYQGIYINGYMATYELAAAVAICAEALGVPFVNRELQDPPSLSKLTAYAKLAAGGVSLPKTFAGAKTAILNAKNLIPTDIFPAVLKRADADRGIDNYKVASYEEAVDLLAAHDDLSVWLLQEFVPNNGFYLVSFYDEKPVFSIFRTLEERPDKNEQKAHMFKPFGGANASLIPLEELPKPLLETSTRAIEVMNRQIGSVDCLFDEVSQRVYVLEVNYNPQLVTIKTFKETRVEAFLDYLQKDWNNL